LQVVAWPRRAHRVEASFIFGNAGFPMMVRVLLFASYADALGASEVQLDLPAGARVRDVLSRVREMASGKRVPDKPMVAVNQRYARDDQAVNAADEVAIIPPVAGG
jgi:sulfur-carrier protein